MPWFRMFHGCVPFIWTYCTNNSLTILERLGEAVFIKPAVTKYYALRCMCRVSQTMFAEAVEWLLLQFGHSATGPSDGLFDASGGMCDTSAATHESILSCFHFDQKILWSEQIFMKWDEVSWSCRASLWSSSKDLTYNKLLHSSCCLLHSRCCLTNARTSLLASNRPPLGPIAEWSNCNNNHYIFRRQWLKQAR